MVLYVISFTGIVDHCAVFHVSSQHTPIIRCSNSEQDLRGYQTMESKQYLFMKMNDDVFPICTYMEAGVGGRRYPKMNNH